MFSFDDISVSQKKETQVIIQEMPFSFAQHIKLWHTTHYTPVLFCCDHIKIKDNFFISVLALGYDLIGEYVLNDIKPSIPKLYPLSMTTVWKNPTTNVWLNLKL